jgi:hypothetical protein
LVFGQREASHAELHFLQFDCCGFGQEALQDACRNRGC